MTNNNATNVLLIGIDYFSTRSSGDKNFWHNLLPKMAEEINQIVVVSFNYRKDPVEIQHTSKNAILIFNVKPSHIGVDLRPVVGNPEKCHAHFKSPPRSVFEYLLSFLRIRRLLMRIIDEHSITNVHCMDNFGPALRLIQKWFSPLPLSVSAMGYYARGVMHDRYLRLCYGRLDAVVPFSTAYNAKLLELGIAQDKIHTVPWGRDIESVGLLPLIEERIALKRDLDVPSDMMLVLWTGFIQQIRKRELLKSLEVAHELVESRADVYFVFALKPECYDPIYQEYASPRIRILTTSNDVFLNLMRSSDYLLSPIVNLQSIATPPLTWIEAMAIGLPIVTNRVRGVESVIDSGETGFISETLDVLAETLDFALSYNNKENMRSCARHHVANNYTIAESVTGYKKLWHKLQAGQ